MTRELLYALALSLVLFVAQSDAEPDADYIYVCKGDSVKLFADTAFNPEEETSVTLYHNGNSVGFWTSNEPKCNNKICRDGNNNIWLHDFSERDNGVYALRCLRRIFGTIEKQKERKFLVAIPPLSSCKPQLYYQPLEREIGYLTAALPKIGCGNPHVTLFWLNKLNQQYNDLMNMSQDHLKLVFINSTEKPGAHIVCIRGPALGCVRDQPYTDYCSEIHVHVYKGEGRQLDAVKCTDTTNGSHWSVVFIMLTFMVVTIHCLLYSKLNFWEIRNLVSIFALKNFGFIPDMETLQTWRPQTRTS